MRDRDIAQARLTCGHIYKRPFSLLAGVGMPATCALLLSAAGARLRSSGLGASQKAQVLHGFRFKFLL